MSSFIKPIRIEVWLVSVEVFSPAEKYKSVMNQTREFYEMTNDGNETIYLAFWQDAEVWKWTPLYSWDRYYLDKTKNIDSYFIRFWCNAISEWDTALSIQEFNYSNWL